MVDFRKLIERDKKLDMIKELLGVSYDSYANDLSFENKLDFDNLLISLYNQLI